MDLKSKNRNKYLAFLIAYLIIACTLLFIYHSEIFDLNVNQLNWNIYYRLLWCYSFGLLGFATLVTKLIINASDNNFFDKSPGLRYTFYYPIMILMTSVGVFTILNINAENLKTLFYAGGACLSFFLGYFIDSLWKITEKLIDKIGKKPE